MKDVLNEIIRLRMQRGWTEYELSQRADIPQSTISTWYSKKQVPTLYSLDKICKGFGITMSQFFSEGEDTLTLTAEQRELLDNWSALNETQKQIVNDLIKNM